MPAKSKQLDEGAGDDSEIGAGLFAGDAGMVMHSHLGDAIAEVFGFGQNFRVYQGAGRLYFNGVEESCGVDLEGAVDIPQFHAEDQVHQSGPGPCV